jgi:hypothetical protein
MENPSLPPRHRRRMRRIIDAAQVAAASGDRATTDAAVLARWLSGEQRGRYAPWLRSGDDPVEFVARLADERRVVLEEGADPVPDELDSATAAEHAAHQSALRVLETVWVLAALGCFGGMVVMREEALWLAVLMGGAALSLVLAGATGAWATRRRDRRLLDWAVSRPGQLGRGIPVATPLQKETLGPALLIPLAPAALLGAGVLGIVAGAGVLLVSLLMRPDTELDLLRLCLILLGAGVVSLIGSVLASRWRAHRLELIVRRASAVEWFGASV